MITPKVTKCKGILSEGKKCEENVYYLPQIVPGTDVAKFLFSATGQPESLKDNIASELTGLADNGFNEVVEIYLTCELNHTNKYWLARNAKKESSNI